MIFTIKANTNHLFCGIVCFLHLILGKSLMLAKPHLLNTVFTKRPANQLDIKTVFIRNPSLIGVWVVEVR